MGRLTIPYIKIGQPVEGRRPFLLFNGISMNEDNWGRLPEALDREVYAIGIARGDRAWSVPTIGHYARYMTRAVEEIVGEEYDALGLSWGGLLVQKMHRGMNKRVIAASMPATPYAFTNIPDRRAIQVVMSTKRTPEGAALLYGGDVRDNPDLVSELHIDRHIDLLRHARQQFAAFTSGTLALEAMADSVWSWAPRQPDTMVMAGTDDPLMNYNAVSRGARWMGARLCTVQNGGHGFLLTRPEQSAEDINAFLDAQDSHLALSA